MALGASGLKAGGSAILRSRQSSKEDIMTYRVYTGPPGAARISPMEKERSLYKEFGLLDEALGFARHVNSGGRVTLLIEGDDGTRLDKAEIVAALRHPEEGSDRKSTR